MEQDADKPDERRAGISLNEAGDVIIDLDAYAAEHLAKARDANPRDDLPGLDDDVDEAVRLAENALVDDGEDKDDSSQLAMLRSSVTDYETSDDEHSYLEDESNDESILSQLLAIEADIEIDSDFNQDEPTPPEPVLAVETPSLIRRIARLIFGGFR